MENIAYIKMSIMKILGLKKRRAMDSADTAIRKYVSILNP